jgi:hypothetical protein
VSRQRPKCPLPDRLTLSRSLFRLDRILLHITRWVNHETSLCQHAEITSSKGPLLKRRYTNVGADRIFVN